DAVQLAANAVCLGDTLVLSGCGERLRAELEERGYGDDDARLLLAQRGRGLLPDASPRSALRGTRQPGCQRGGMRSETILRAVGYHGSRTGSGTSRMGGSPKEDEMDAPTLTDSLARETAEVLAKLGVEPELVQDGALMVRSPITGDVIVQLRPTDAASAKGAIAGAQQAFRAWRKIPPPRRGELVRLFAEELRAAKPELARLVTIEVGKIPSE